MLDTYERWPAWDADERTRTSTWFPRHGPEPCASTNSATSACRRASEDSAPQRPDADEIREFVCARARAQDLRRSRCERFASLVPVDFTPLSSRGLGRRPLMAETRVRIPVAVLNVSSTFSSDVAPSPTVRPRGCASGSETPGARIGPATSGQASRCPEAPGPWVLVKAPAEMGGLPTGLWCVVWGRSRRYSSTSDAQQGSSAALPRDPSSRGVHRSDHAAARRLGHGDLRREQTGSVCRLKRDRLCRGLATWHPGKGVGPPA